MKSGTSSYDSGNVVIFPPSPSRPAVHFRSCPEKLILLSVKCIERKSWKRHRFSLERNSPIVRRVRLATERGLRGGKKGEGSLLSRRWFLYIRGRSFDISQTELRVERNCVDAITSFPFFLDFIFQLFLLKISRFCFSFFCVELLTGAKTTGPIQSSSLRI